MFLGQTVFWKKPFQIFIRAKQKTCPGSESWIPSRAGNSFPAPPGAPDDETQVEHESPGRSPLELPAGLAVPGDFRVQGPVGRATYLFSMRRFWYFTLHSLLPPGALLLHVVVFISYARRWDKLAALTVFPFWAWGLLGMGMAGFAWLFTRQRLALGVAGLWLVTVLGFSDETRPLLRSWKPQPEPGAAAPAPDGSKVRRLITLNCKAGFFNPASPREVIPWQPDVVLFQETAQPAVLRQVAQELYGGNPAEHAIGSWECGIITRGKILRSGVGAAPNTVTASIQFDDGSLLEVASVHLHGAETDVRLYKRETLYKHALNRLTHRAELQQLLNVQTMLNHSQLPALIGGDFNAPAGDSIFRLLTAAGFTDAIATAGSGWPDTYPNQAPMLRIDHLWANARLTPVRGRTVKTVHSDHRMVISDFIVR